MRKHFTVLHWTFFMWEFLLALKNLNSYTEKLCIWELPFWKPQPLFYYILFSLFCSLLYIIIWKEVIYSLDETSNAVRCDINVLLVWYFPDLSWKSVLKFGSFVTYSYLLLCFGLHCISSGLLGCCSENGGNMFLDGNAGKFLLDNKVSFPRKW